MFRAISSIIRHACPPLHTVTSCTPDPRTDRAPHGPASLVSASTDPPHGPVSASTGPSASPGPPHRPVPAPTGA